ncbi:MAG: GerMN domain-containing protein [bacterium]
MRRSLKIIFLVMTVLVAVASFFWWWYQVPEGVDQPQKLPEEKVVLYYLNEQRYALQSVERTVPEATDRSARVKQIVQQLTKSPDESELIRLLPPELKLRSSYMNGQTIYLDFSDQLIGAARGTSGEMMLLYSIVNSVLKNLPEKYKLVHFLIEGEMRKTIGPYGEDSGHIAIQYPLGPRWNLTAGSS